jgi:short subunit dehydrogenase-like uncharacterized protein
VADQSGPIAVYGATGYTGRLIAAELRRRDAEFLLAGRNAAKLGALAEELGGGVRTTPVALDDAAGLRALLDPCAAVIACAGPFTLHGEPVLAAAVDTATHYVDTTGEQPYIRMTFDRYGKLAERAGSIAVSALGFDYAPGDMIAALTASGLGRLDDLQLAYAVSDFGATHGTMLSALEIMRGGDVEYRAGAWHPASQRADRGSFDFPEPFGHQRMVRYPSGEQITVPRHVDTHRVTTKITATTMIPNRHVAAAAPVLMPALGLAMRTPARGVFGRLVSRLPEGPGEDARRKSRFLVVCDARAGARRRRGTVTGTDVYGLTAATTVEGALRAAAPGYEHAGALAPAQAFDPGDYLDALAGHGVAYEVEPPGDEGADSEPAERALHRG